MRGLLLVVAALAVGCGAPGAVAHVRFYNRPPIWRVNDRHDIPKPKGTQNSLSLYHFDGYYHRRITRLLEVPEPTRAANVNSLDEVPDSTWFTNRIGVRELGVDEIRRGPNQDDGPDTSAPWQITGTKVGGLSVGLQIKDARGRKYILKFDEPGIPEMETAADVIVQRLLWACGYNVPEDSIVYFRREQLVLAPDADVKDVFGNKRPMTERDLDEAFTRIDVGADGRIRGLASKYLPGVPLGGYSREGMREDDPNDVFAHEERRDVRGQYPIFAWLAHNDVKIDNTLDTWVEDPAQPGQHYVVHWLLDFGKSLGVMGRVSGMPHYNFAQAFDFQHMAYSLLSVGLWRRPWEGVQYADIKGVGYIESELFDPGGWKPRTPYFAYNRADRFDKFWGAKIIIRFTPEQIAAAVEQGKLSDPRATHYLTRVLIERQRKTARHWFRQVTPLDRVEARAGDGNAQVCFEDLSLIYDLEPEAGGTRYELATYDYDGKPTGWKSSVAADGDGRSCVGPFPAAAGDEGYTILLVSTRRGERELPAVLVHLARDPVTRALRLVGIRRQ